MKSEGIYFKKTQRQCFSFEISHFAVRIDTKVQRLHSKPSAEYPWHS